MYKQLDVCKKCTYHRGMNDTMVRCGILEKSRNITVAIPAMPSNYIIGFQNGTVLVNCQGVAPYKKCLSDLLQSK